MSVCRQCGSAVQGCHARTGRVNDYCSPTCRTTWNSSSQGERRRISRDAETPKEARPAYSPERELANRRAEIDRTPSLCAALDRLRRPRTPVPVTELLRRLEADGRREKRRNP